MCRPVMTAAEVAESMDCSESMAYKMIAQMNTELESKGFIIRRGRISRKYFQERTGLELGGGEVVEKDT